MRTDEKLNEICDRLHINCGDIHEAARWVGVSPAFVFAWIKEDAEASKAIEEARRVGYAGLESEAVRRAVLGIQKDVYYKGLVVGQQTEYSDGLLGKLMEARIPEYKKGEGAMNAFNGPTQINIMPRASNYDEWLAMRERTLQDRDKQKAQDALPAPVEGEYVEIEAVDRPLAGLEGLL